MFTLRVTSTKTPEPPEFKIMLARGKKKEKKVIPPYKIVVVRTYIFNFLTH
jgi:hypothetical protein